MSTRAREKAPKTVDIVAAIDALRVDNGQHRELLFAWQERIENITKTHASELLALRSRQDEVDYRLRRLVESTLDGAKLGRWVAAVAVLTGLCAFAGVLAGQLLNH